MATKNTKNTTTARFSATLTSVINDLIELRQVPALDRHPLFENSPCDPFHPNMAAYRSVLPRKREQPVNWTQDLMGDAEEAMAVVALTEPATTVLVLEPVSTDRYQKHQSYDVDQPNPAPVEGIPDRETKIADQQTPEGSRPPAIPEGATLQCLKHNRLCYHSFGCREIPPLEVPVLALPAVDADERGFLQGSVDGLAVPADGDVDTPHVPKLHGFGP